MRYGDEISAMENLCGICPHQNLGGHNRDQSIKRLALTMMIEKEDYDKNRHGHLIEEIGMTYNDQDQLSCTH